MSSVFVIIDSRMSCLHFKSSSVYMGFSSVYSPNKPTDVAGRAVAGIHPAGDHHGQLWLSPKEREQGTAGSPPQASFSPLHSISVMRSSSGPQSVGLHGRTGLGAARPTSLLRDERNRGQQTVTCRKSPAEVTKYTDSWLFFFSFSHA